MNEKLLYEILNEVKGLRESQEDLRHELKDDIQVAVHRLKVINLKILSPY